MDNSPGRELPRYECHKKVHALKIENIKPPQQPEYKGPVCRSMDGCGNCERCTWHRDVRPTAPLTIVPADHSYAPFEVSAEYFAKHKPESGGYFVVYADGYQSYSPAKAFEEGYTRI